MCVIRLCRVQRMQARNRRLKRKSKKFFSRDIVLQSKHFFNQVLRWCCGCVLGVLVWMRVLSGSCVRACRLTRTWFALTIIDRHSS
jgi:hypothetical protein